MISAKELASHDGRNSCWVIIHGKVYDVTDFLDSHPGGAEVILRGGGQDITDDYDSVHRKELVDETLPTSAVIGSIDETTTYRTNRRAPADLTLHKASDGVILNLKDFELAAEKRVTAAAWAYFESAADDEISKARNLKSFRKISLRPRILRNVESIDTRTTILGMSTSMPIFVAPCGLNKLAYPSGECAITSAAGKAGLIQVISTGASMSPESIIAARTNKLQPIFFQLYVNKDIQKSKALIRRVENLGFNSIWLTVDSPVLGKRERDAKISSKRQRMENDGGIAKSTTSYISSRLTWTDLEWIRQETSLPLVIKGIQSVEDAVMAYQHGVQGIVLSNHGGRSQDTSQAPILTLLEIRKFTPLLIRSSMEIYVDGGIRRGTDVLKALALGANAVGVGRPFLHALAVDGENGVANMVEILREELTTNMALAGATKLGEIVVDMVNTSKLEQELTGSVKL